MALKTLVTEPFDIQLINGTNRPGAILRITEESGLTAEGEISPLPNWNKESLQQALAQLEEKKNEILSIDWSKTTFFYHLQKLNLYPSLLFALESALLTLYFPIDDTPVVSSAFLAGNPKEILLHAKERQKEGYTHAKLKVANLSLQEAGDIIHTLKDIFRLRIDVNKTWKTKDTLNFFEQFPENSFDYIEEPLQNIEELKNFKHPFALDETYKRDLHYEKLTHLPLLKALIYKPTVQGGLLNSLPILSWARQFQVDLVLSSSYESPVGLNNIKNIAQRLSLSTPVGIGTNHYLKKKDFK